MTLFDVCTAIAIVEDKLAYGEIDFYYDNLMSAMKPGHPADILDDILSQIGWDVQAGKPVELERVKSMLEDLKGFKETFRVKELKDAIRLTEQYVKEQDPDYEVDDENEDEEDESVIRCANCDELIDKDDAMQVGGKYYCEDCYDMVTVECEDCGKRVPEDEICFWGDCRICKECMDARIPEFDQKENDRKTEPAYSEMKKKYVGRMAVDLDIGENNLEYTCEGDGTDINYTITVTVGSDGKITDISRLSAEMLLAEDCISSDWARYPIDPDDYSDIVEEMFEDLIKENDDD